VGQAVSPAKPPERRPHVRGIRVHVGRFALLALLLGLSLFGQDVATLEAQAQKYLQEQKPELAIPVLEKLVALDPNNVNARANVGVLLFFQDRYAEAIPHLRAALGLHSELSRIEALLGMAERRTGQSKDALPHLERSFTTLDDPKIRIQVGLELIELHSAAGRLENALSVAATLEQLAPQDPQVLLTAYRLARQMMDQSLMSMMVAGPESAEMHMILGGELARRGDRENALVHFREAIRLKPSLPGAHFQIAEQLRSAPDPALNAQAEDEYKAALRVNPYDELSWRELAGILNAKGEFPAAEENYRKALSLQPNDSEAKTGLAIVLIATNRNSDAIPLLESALKDDPTNMTAHYRLSGLYRRGGRTADAEREMAAFRHYQEVKDKLGVVLKQLAVPAGAK
jgi:tetratricopeptide (TPR) repeat protein